MNRREFLSTAGAATVTAFTPRFASGATPQYGNVLILVELKGGNDGLNTVIPYAAPAYYELRPRIGIPREQVLQLDDATGLHPALQPLLPAWQSGELAIVGGVGYPGANLSHFRSIEIWDTASNSDEYLRSGWLARVFEQAPPARTFAADAVIVGSELGPFTGPGNRAIALTNAEQFLQQARLARPGGRAPGGALQHILKVEADVAHASVQLEGQRVIATAFPQTAFGNALRTATQVLAQPAGVAAIKVSLNGFDTHSAQPAVHARLLKDLGEGLVALKAALVELGRWETTLIMTYSEFGRRPRENQSAGTDHGTASSHFLWGGRVRGGLYGAAPDFGQLDGTGNLPHAVDFRSLYATVLERWWQLDARGLLRTRPALTELIKA